MANDKQQSGGNEGSSKQSGGSGNFADDPQRASEAGKKGGQHSHDGDSRQANQSGSGRSQQGSVKSDSDDDLGDSEKSNGRSKDKR
jgi:uncharacterized protein